MLTTQLTRNTIATATLIVLTAAGCGLQPVDAASESIASLPIGIDPGSIAIGPGPTYGGNFTVHALGHMCLDFGGQAYWAPGAPVTLYWCNGTIAQQLNVQEVPDAGHDVTLHLGNGDNNYCIGARGAGQSTAGAVLEIQTCNGSGAQEFALDGDSIIAGWRAPSSITKLGYPTPKIVRNLVAKPLGDVTNAKTPIVLAPRDLTDSEYFRFVATDGSNRKPHSGFVTPANGPDLVSALPTASWGTVFDLDDNITYEMNGQQTAMIPAAVTLRGNRKLTNLGALVYDYENETRALFEIPAGSNYARITGLRIQGATWGTDQAPNLTAIRVHDDYQTPVSIDHNEITHFTSNAIEVAGPNGNTHWDYCPSFPPAMPRPTPVRVSGNSIRDNVGANDGYGVISGYGAFPLVERNAMYQNRHSITASSDTNGGYFATDNYVLSDAPNFGSLDTDHTSNFDVHGTLNENCHTHWGGYAGDYVIIQYNTFLSTDRQNINIRGQGCRTSVIDGNIFADGSSYTTYPYPSGLCSAVAATDGAIVVDDLNGIPTRNPPTVTTTTNNLYDQPARVADMAVGDFDGDGIDDIFTGTGNGWFYSSGGKSEWRWLRRGTETTGALRFGDLDGDGRADVIKVDGATLAVSWGGISGWQTLTSTPATLPITSYFIGNFDNDRLHGDDIFATDGATWYLARNGRNFQPVQTSKVPASQLRFGDFDGDGRTDVFSIVNNAWSYSTAAVGSWQPIAGAPGNTDLADFIVGDFDGDGRTDIGRYYISGHINPWTPIWKFDYSPAARAPFINARVTSTMAAWAGHFADGSGVVWWEGNGFDLAHGSAASLYISRQYMK